jgi:hypothetical protein
MRQAVRTLEREAAVEVDPNYPRQALVGDDLVDLIVEPVNIVRPRSHAPYAVTLAGSTR